MQRLESDTRLEQLAVELRVPRRTVGFFIMKGLLLTLIVAFGLGGCAGLTQFPDTSVNYSDDLKKMDGDYNTALGRSQQRRMLRRGDSCVTMRSTDVFGS